MTWIQTYTGKAFDLINPQPDMIDIVDIAHALAHQCRFMGHTREFYSVAQHSILVSQQVPPEHALEGLLHDAAEAYCVDLAAPIKRLPDLEGYCRYEKLVRGVAAIKFGLAPELPREVVVADMRMLMTEAKLLHKTPQDWGVPAEPYPDLEINPLPPDVAEAMFLASFRELGGKA